LRGRSPQIERSQRRDESRSERIRLVWPGAGPD